LAHSRKTRAAKAPKTCRLQPLQDGVAPSRVRPFRGAHLLPGVHGLRMERGEHAISTGTTIGDEVLGFGQRALAQVRLVCGADENADKDDRTSLRRTRTAFALGAASRTDRKAAYDGDRRFVTSTDAGDPLYPHALPEQLRQAFEQLL